MREKGGGGALIRERCLSDILAKGEGAYWSVSAYSTKYGRKKTFISGSQRQFIFPIFLLSCLPSLLISYPDPTVELECTHGRVNSGYETISLLPLHRFCKREDLQKRPIMQCYL